MGFKKGDLVAWIHDKTALAIVVEVGFILDVAAPFIRVLWLTDNSPELRGWPKEWDPILFYPANLSDASLGLCPTEPRL